MSKKQKQLKEYIGENVAIIACSNLKLYIDGIPKDFKMWGINSLCKYYSDKLDLLFDMHPWNDTSNDYPIPDYYQWLKENEYDYCIVKPDYDPEIKNVILYPLHQILNKYGRNLKNSLPEMILYAWYLNEINNKKRIKNIYLYGISDGEFTKYPEMGFSLYQAVGFARASGINIFFVNDFEMDRDDDIYGFYRLTKSRIKE